MQKALPITLLVIIVLAIAGGGFWLFKSSTKPLQTQEVVDEETLKELPLEDRPYTTLKPGPSCEYTLSLENIKKSPVEVEYEISYKNEEDVTQGASGSIKPKSATSGTKKILFGSESSGHRRCDKGVDGGELTLKYRDEEGKLIAMLDTKFEIIEDESIFDLGGIYTVKLDKAITERFVAMPSLGLPEDAPNGASDQPYSLFTNNQTKINATVTAKDGKVYQWIGSNWKELSNGKTTSLGTFISVK